MKGSQVASDSRVVVVLGGVLLTALRLLPAAPLKGGHALRQTLMLPPPRIIRLIQANGEGIELLVKAALEEAVGEVDGERTQEGNQNGVGVDGHVPIVPRVGGVVKQSDGKKFEWKGRELHPHIHAYKACALTTIQPPFHMQSFTALRTVQPQVASVRLFVTAKLKIYYSSCGTLYLLFRGLSSVPGWIRTNDLPLRRRLLYPAGLREQVDSAAGLPYLHL
jgi:hypothetical protein